MSPIFLIGMIVFVVFFALLVRGMVLALTYLEENYKPKEERR